MRRSRAAWAGVTAAVTAAACVLALLAAGPAAGAWRYPRDTIGGSGANLAERTITASNVSHLARVWRAGSSFDYFGGVTTGHGRVFYGTGAGWRGRTPRQVVARSVRTGRVLWRTVMPGTTLSTPVVSDGLVFVAVSDVIGSSQGILYALSARTGRVRWSHGQTGAFAALSISPVVRKGRVYVLWEDSAGTMSALDEWTGATIWSRTGAGDGPLSYAAHRLIDPNGRVYSPHRGKDLGGYPPVRGHDMQHAIANGMIYEAGFQPASYGAQIAEAVAYPLSCVPQWRRACKPVWSAQLPAPIGGIPSTIAVTRRRVFIPTSSWTWDGPGGVVALDARTGALRWQWTDPGDQEGWQVSVGGNVAYLITRRATDFTAAHLDAFATVGCGHRTCPPLGSWIIGQQTFSPGSYPVIQHGTVLIMNDNGDGLWAYRLAR